MYQRLFEYQIVKLRLLRQLLSTDVSAYLKKVAIKGDKLISIIDLEKILNDNEIKRLSRVAKKAEAEAKAKD